MCVYCKNAADCDHERDDCAASRGEVCAECGHASAVGESYKPRRVFPWSDKGPPRKRKPLTRADQRPATGRGATAKRRSKRRSP
jgi:hypothetical protein